MIDCRISLGRWSDLSSAWVASIGSDSTTILFIYHLVAPGTREGRVQEVMLKNIEAAAESLGGRMFDLLDATFSRATGDGFDLAAALSRAQADPNAPIDVPDVATLRRTAEDLVHDENHLRSKVNHAAWRPFPR